MVKMSEDIINRNQDLINYLNADNMFLNLDNILKEYGKDFILKEEHDTEEECVRSYVVRSTVMKVATECIEHYAKAILIQNGHSWDESKSWGHNLLNLYNSLDEKSKSHLSLALMPINTFDNLDVNDYLNQNKIYDENLFIKIISKLDRDISNPDLINYQADFLNEYDTYDYVKDLPKIQSIKDHVNITHFKGEETIDTELEKLYPQNTPGKPKEQLFSIKARFPGQYLVSGNAEFLISLTYAFNGLSNIYRNINGDAR